MQKKKWSLLAASLLLLQSSFAVSAWAATPVAPAAASAPTLPQATSTPASTLSPTATPITGDLEWAASHPTFKILSEEPITSGAILRKLVWTTTRSGKTASVNVDAIQVDLQNPNVKLDVMTGTNNQFTKKQSVMGMAQETGAVAGVNGDFFDTQAEGVPIGGEISNSQMMATPPYLPGFYSFAIDKDNHPIIDEFTFQGSIKTKDGASYPLGGVNKTYYWYEADGPKPPTPQVDDIDGVHSMIDGLYMYTNAWGQVGRSNDGVTNPSEVLVQYNRISNIGISQIINLIPPKEGYILRAAGKAADFVQQHMQLGDPLIADYSILPADPTKKYDANHFKMMIGGGTILVDEGMPATFTRNDADNRSYRSRTSVGYSQDQRYAYIITADHSSGSAGASLADMQSIMVQMGVWKGMNFDGGGSTQMVSRPLGQYGLQLVNQTENGDQRKVVNGLAVYSLAKPGEVKDFTIQGETNLLLNEKTSYRLSGYDEFYNPAQMDTAKPAWSMTNGIGMFDGNTFTALKPGETELTATLGKAQRTLKVQVIGKDQIASMRVIPSSTLISDNSDIALQVEITTKTGEKKIAPPEAIHWELRGFEGTVQGNTLHVGKLASDNQQAAVIASYDGYNAMAALDRGVRNVWANFDQITPAFTFDKYPADVGGAVSLITGLSGKAANDRSLYLQYDFTSGSATKAAYALFGTAGLPIPGQPQSIRLQVMGDNSLNWLRAEVVDANGVLQRVDLAQPINWSGWRTLDIGLSDLKLAYPITLKRLYVANPEQGQDERAARGAIAIDDISFLNPLQPTTSIPSPKIQLTIDKNVMQIDNKPMTIDQPPVIVKDNTLVPIRFVTEALGGEIGWDDAERKVTVVKGSHYIELWVDRTELIMDGQRVTAEVAPQIINDRTMVPLRLLSEKLGWKVTWDNDTRSITLE